jgi:hypothetical protein
MQSAVLAARGWRRWLLPPLVAFLVSIVVLAVAAVVGGFNPADTSRWASFDSPIYVSIAQHGYTDYVCPQAQLDQGATACGTFGWFPLYPALMRPLMDVGLAPNTAGVVVSLVFFLALLVLLWNGLMLPRGGRALLPALGLAAFAPGALYFHTVYPMALTAFLLTLALVALARERWAWAGAAGFVAAVAYPGAALLAVVAGIWLLFIAPAPTLSERVRRIALVSVPTVAGFGVVLLYAQLKTGQWDGYFGVQARFHHGVHLPFANWLDISRPRTEGLGHISLFLSWQEYFVTALSLIVIVTTVVRRRVATAFDWLLVLWTFAFWAVPLMQNTVAYYRTDALMIPIAVAFTQLPARIVSLLALIGAFVAAGMTIAFMQGVLV